jgi:hypothetical protein
MGRPAWLLVAAAMLCSPARGGIVEESRADLAHGGFELGLGPWQQAASDGSSPFQLAPSPSAQGASAFASLAPGVSGSLALDAGPTELPVATSGAKLEARGAVWLTPGAGTGALSLELQSFDGSSWTTLAESALLDAALAPRGRWLRLSTLPVPLLDARVPRDSQGLRFVFHCSVSGGVYFDDLEVGRFNYAEYPLADPSFEGEGGEAWATDGALVLHDGRTQPDGYYGRGHLKLGPQTAQRAWQVLASSSTEWASPEAGRELEAGAWFRPSVGLSLPTSPDPALFVELAVFGVDGGGVERRLAHGRWHPTATSPGAWRFLQAGATGPVLSGHERVRVELRSTLPGEVAVDFVQLGESHAIDGNPKRRVGANYVGRYRSPLFPGAAGSPASAQERWRNWRWVAPNACSSVFGGFFHDPDCATSSTCLRGNGRRDLAISTRRGEDQLPLIGAYDSRDPAVVRYHVDLAEAAGIDHFIFDWLGHKLSRQNVLQGREPINEQTLEVLLDVADEPGRDFKVAVMYEPKVHYLGWVAGQPSEAEKLAGIVEDLVWLVEHQRTRRSALRRDGALVVFVFRDTQCTPDGQQCLDAQDWSSIAQAVESTTGESLFLVGDVAQAAGSPMSGVSRWQLVDLELLEHRTYQDAQAGVTTLPRPAVARLESHARAVHAVGAGWAAADDARRVSVAVVWPGFDDTGVGGWGVSNLMGADGQALCVRVCSEFDGAFYSTVVASALDTGTDWIQVATWNDWNEDTQLEPAWERETASGRLLDLSASPHVRDHVFGRLLETQAWVAHFKGVELEPQALPRAAAGYLRRAASTPGVTQYD